MCRGVICSHLRDVFFAVSITDSEVVTGHHASTLRVHVHPIREISTFTTVICALWLAHGRAKQGIPHACFVAEPWPSCSSSSPVHRMSCEPHARRSQKSDGMRRTTDITQCTMRAGATACKPNQTDATETKRQAGRCFDLMFRRLCREDSAWLSMFRKDSACAQLS